MSSFDYPIYIIVVEQSPTSQWYYHRVLPSWQEHGYTPIVFPANTPETIQHRTELKFSWVHALKYVSRRIKKPFSITEQACWYSHYDLWKKCIELDQPIAIIEHDVMLVKPENLKVHADLSFFDASAMGGYVINPKAAKCLVEYVTNLPQVFSTPYSLIVHLSSSDNPRRNEITYTLHTLPDSWRKKKELYATMQIFNHSLGRTIDRYNDIDPNLALLFEYKVRDIPTQIHVHEDTTQWMLDRGYPPVPVKISKNFREPC